MHVYGDGGVCLGKVNAAKYSASTSLTEIAISLFKMMHEKPTEGDPANVGLSEVFKKNQK
jgi:ubiquitin-protein ligase